MLNSPDIPSILIETGYLTNPEEAQRLSNRNFQERMALAIADGVASYFYEAPPAARWLPGKGKRRYTDIYTVRRGDTLSEIAEQFSLSVTELKSINGLQGNTIQIGQVLELPGSDSLLTRTQNSAGETLSEIAQFYRVSLADLREANNLRGDRILIGQTLIIPPARQ